VAGNRSVAALLLVAAILCGSTPASAQGTRRYGMSGIVIEVDRARKSMVVAHEEVPGVMPAMTMPFDVPDARDLARLAPGMTVRFTLVLDRQAGHAEGIDVVAYQSAEQDPFTARRLQLLRRLTGTTPGVEIGAQVPDFTLIDQTRRPTTLSQLRGTVVVLNFIYTSCVLPQFCYRMTNHFSVLQKRFARQMGSDIVLLTVSFDPVRDTPERLADYASEWKADARTWHFLTGTADDVRRVCASFGVDFFPDEGLITHSVHIAVIDRSGTLRANIEGNQMTAAQLGDIVAAVLTR
jgi:protein SCO1/2